jgi:CRP/FNR family transcriptional regulator, anaerobic regulatory protein
MLEQHLPVERRMLHAGDTLYRAGDRFTSLYLVHAGLVKLVSATADGREQVAGFHFKNDWLGLDGIGSGTHDADAVAMDTCEVWRVSYDAFLRAAAAQPALLALLHVAMSQAMARERAGLMSVCSRPADARVADFLRDWGTRHEQAGLRSDRITLRMSRAEIGSYLGMTLESVSRAFARLARDELISFPEKGRREIGIPSIEALADFVEDESAPRGTLQ